MAGNSLAISTPTATWGTRAGAAPRWIVNRNVDLIFIIGSVLAGYAYVVLNVVMQVPITLLWWFWSVGFDGTHIFGTASRTYFDREAMRKHGRLFLGGLACLFLLGPAMVASFESKYSWAISFCDWLQELQPKQSGDSPEFGDRFR